MDGYIEGGALNTEFTQQHTPAQRRYNVVHPHVLDCEQFSGYSIVDAVARRARKVQNEVPFSQYDTEVYRRGVEKGTATLPLVSSVYKYYNNNNNYFIQANKLEITILIHLQIAEGLI